MGVKSGGASGFDFVLGKQFGKLGARLAGVFWKFGKGGGEAAPPHIFYQNCPFFLCSRTLLSLNLFEGTDGIEIQIELLLGRTFTKAVGVGDTVTIEILRAVV